MRRLVGILMMGVSFSVSAGLFGNGGTSWQEEAILHDDRKIIIERSVERGGRHEIGQKPAFMWQKLTFAMPDSKERIVWEDSFSEDLGSSSFNPMLVDIVAGNAYVVATPKGCISYNKSGRPNPPYVVFKHGAKLWQRIRLEELPTQIKTPNIVISSPDDVAKAANYGLLTAAMIKQENGGFVQPEFKTILREPVPNVGNSCPDFNSSQFKSFKPPIPIPPKQEK